MTILTAPARKSKSKAPRPFSCSIVSLTIEISDTRYSVDAIPLAGEFGTKAFRLCKHSGDHQVYDVIHTHAGVIECDCPDYVMRHAEDGTPCKHSRALVELGLLSAPNDGPFPDPLRDATNDFPQPAERQDVATAADLPIKRDEAPPLACCPASTAEPCGSCIDVLSEHNDTDPWDVEADPARWPADTDADVWSIVDPEGDDDHLRNAAGGNIPSHQEILIDSDDRLTLHDLVERQRRSFESWGNDAGQLLADHMGELVATLALTSATSPAEYRDRSRQIYDSTRSAWFDAGLASCACRCEAPGGGWGHDA